MPVRRPPLAVSRWAIRRTVVVLPLVPVTATTGMRPSSPSSNMEEMIASPTARPLPKDGDRCMRRPGAALTSTMPPFCVLDRLEHAVAHQVDAADVQAHHVRRFDRARRHFRMHVVGDVGGRAAGGQVGVVAQDHALAARRHRVGQITLLGQAGQRDVVEADLGQRGGMAVAAARVAVDLSTSWRPCAGAVADHDRRIAPGGGDQLVADNQQAEVIARQVALDQDVVAEFAGGVKAGRQLFLV
jgi:hypothetical protein